MVLSRNNATIIVCVLTFLFHKPILKKVPHLPPQNVKHTDNKMMYYYKNILNQIEGYLSLLC